MQRGADKGDAFLEAAPTLYDECRGVKVNQRFRGSPELYATSVV